MRVQLKADLQAEQLGLLEFGTDFPPLFLYVRTRSIQEQRLSLDSQPRVACRRFRAIAILKFPGRRVEARFNVIACSFLHRMNAGAKRILFKQPGRSGKILESGITGHGSEFVHMIRNVYGLFWQES